MRLYLDDDIASVHLARLLRKAGHDVRLPSEAGLSGESDAVHLAYAVRENRVCLTRNYDDFQDLHKLILEVKGHHPGILVVRRDNDPRRNLTPGGIVRAIGNLVAANIVLVDEYQTLNHWR
jgi:predicted nuclease of predicted toxin-antitoxin system